jgi:KDO2-lipid IV(A) lauroyltransferase
MKQIRYRIEYGILVAMLAFLGLMTPEKSSGFAGKIGRKFGPKLSASKKALTHLKIALPGKTDAEYQTIITGMWDNLARVIAEYQHLEYFAPDVELAGIDHLKGALEKHGHVILFSGHIANWEMMAPCLLRYNMPVDLVYRAPNNPWSDKLLNRYRTLNGKLRTLPKSKTGTRHLVESLKQKRSIALLIDQKYNEGIEAPFFGKPAMTSTAFVVLAQKFDCGLVPFRVERMPEGHFRLSFYPPLAVVNDDNTPRAAADVIAEAHELLESWIKERPEQWLWQHRRWGNDPLQPKKKPNRKNSQPRTTEPAPPAA